MKFKNWLVTMLDEKGIDKDTTIYEFEHKNVAHMVEMNHLIEFLDMLPADQKKAIKSNLVRIDFKNGDIEHFLRYLAKGYVELNY